jgi:molecular chaperone HscB
MANHFAVFDLPVNFLLDTTVLKSKWRALQSQFHPDRGIYDEETSTRLNLANDTLENPLLRALHILELNGHSIDEGAMFEELDFLEGQLEYNERIEQAKNTKNKGDLETIELEVVRKINEQITAYTLHQTTAVEPVRKWLFLNKVRKAVDEAKFKVDTAK